MNGQTGIEFREKILSKGNSAPPDQLYRISWDETLK